MDFKQSRNTRIIKTLHFNDDTLVTGYNALSLSMHKKAKKIHV